MSGWIKLHRKLLDWEWYNDLNCRVLFIHCLLLANYDEKKWRGVDVERGSFISSIAILSQSSGLTIRQVRTALTKLKSTGEMTSKGHSEYSVFTVVRYNEYQESDTPKDKPATSKRQAKDKQATTTKEYKEYKEVKEDETVYRSFNHLSITRDECNKLFLDGYTVEQINNILDSIQNYKKNNTYTSLYLTAKKWLMREHGDPKVVVETKPDTLMDWEWEAMLRNREEVRKIQAYAAKEK